MLYAENIGLRDCSGFLQIGSHSSSVSVAIYSYTEQYIRVIQYIVHIKAGLEPSNISSAQG